MCVCVCQYLRECERERATDLITDDTRVLPLMTASFSHCFFFLDSRHRRLQSILVPFSGELSSVFRDETSIFRTCSKVKKTKKNDILIVNSAWQPTDFLGAKNTEIGA